MADVNFTCGICERPQPMGTAYQRLRLVAEDFADNPNLPAKQKAGLYACCERCWKIFAPKLLKRLGKTEEQLTAHDGI